MYTKDKKVCTLTQGTWHTEIVALLFVFWWHGMLFLLEIPDLLVVEMKMQKLLLIGVLCVWQIGVSVLLA